MLSIIAAIYSIPAHAPGTPDCRRYNKASCICPPWSGKWGSIPCRVARGSSPLPGPSAWWWVYLIKTIKIDIYVHERFFQVFIYIMLLHVIIISFNIYNNYANRVLNINTNMYIYMIIKINYYAASSPNPYPKRLRLQKKRRGRKKQEPIP